MHTYRKITAFCLCLVVFGTLSGCAKKRGGPHDVPSATSGASGAAGGGYGGSGGFAGQPEDVRKAAAEIGAAAIYFDFDKYALKPEAESTLSRVAEILRRYPSIRISIRGHCDARGSAEYNYALGERRARAAYGYLLRVGVNPAQLDMVTHGKKSPAVTGTSKDAMARNRRDEFLVLTTCY